MITNSAPFCSRRLTFCLAFKLLVALFSKVPSCALIYMYRKKRADINNLPNIKFL